MTLKKEIYGSHSQSKIRALLAEKSRSSAGSYPREIRGQSLWHFAVGPSRRRHFGFQNAEERLRRAALARVTIERTGKYVRVNLHTARPGVIIGKKGADIEELKKEIQEMTNSEATINVVEIKRPELDAQLVAEGVAFQLEKQ